MKLIYRILIRLIPALIVFLAIWSYFFYAAVIDEVNDEMDDALEDYSEDIIMRALAGQDLPSASDGSNNTYYLKEVTAEYARATPRIRYTDALIYIKERKETEPARILLTIFKDSEGNYFELSVSTPSIEKEDLRLAILNWMITLTLTLLVILVSVNIWVFLDSLRPLYTLLKWLDSYTVGEEVPLPDLKTGITEFRKLHVAAQKTIERNQAIYEQQKQFIGNASHELQTPLAICQNRLEMLAEQEDTTERQLAEINKIQETLAYIIRLNKSLLFLSKIENGQFRDNRMVCLNDILHRQLEDYQDIYAYKGIRLRLAEEGQLHADMSPTLATALATNLLKNTYIHNIPGGEIDIRITPRSLTFRNTGIPEALDSDRVFHRFYQGKTPGQNSSGLGLSISQAICHLYHIRIAYRYDGMHCFELLWEKTEK